MKKWGIIACLFFVVLVAVVSVNVHTTQKADNGVVSNIWDPEPQPELYGGLA